MPTPVFSWEGYDLESGERIEIHSGQLVRWGNTIEIYDHTDNEYREIEIESIRRFGSTVEIEGYDFERKEKRIFEMQD